MLPLKARSARNSTAALVAALACAASPAFAADSLDTLALAYPDTIQARAGNDLILRNGVRLDAGVSDSAMPFDVLLKHASIRDMFRMAYPAGAPLVAPAESFDPGRFRNKAFFDGMYGDCRKGEVAPNLVSVVWLPKHWGHSVEVTRINGVANQLREVSDEIDALPDPVRRAAWPSAGTYACREVADAGQPSMHAYGAAIDLNLAFSSYWLWDNGKAAHAVIWRNQMPAQIVNIFERHGFIWGGRWYHYDTMHFEYRPELLGLAPAPTPR
jgi:D-alanyl-D-alanine carboxypeptidase